MRMDENSVEKWQRADEEIRKNLPPGVKLVRTLRGHTDYISLIAWSPNGRILASSSADGTIRLWDAETGESLRTIKGHKRGVWCVAFDPTGEVLASGDDDCVKLWETNSGNLLNILEMNTEGAVSLAFDPMGHTLASGTYDKKVKLWEVTSGKLLHTLKGHSKSVGIISFDPTGHTLASGSQDGTVKIWEVASGKLLHTLKRQFHGAVSLAFDQKSHTLAIGSVTEISLWEVGVWKLSRVLEGHTGDVSSINFSSNIPLFASKSIHQREILLWRTDTFDCVAKISFGESNYEWMSPNIVFHPHLPQFAAIIWDTSQPEGKPSAIQIYELALPVLFSQDLAPMVSYTSAKIVLVGDSGVGKTGLGWRLAHGEFKEHSSTHGQQFWLLNQLCKQRRDGTQCEAVLWDLARQPDYRLIHALFLDDADLALVLFDSTRNDDPLSGVEYWLTQLKVKAELPNGTPTVLIAARSDRGTPRLTKEELNAFCEQRGIKACLLTSAKSGEGLEELVQQMQNMISWDDKPATVTTETFKKIKDFILEMKGNRHRRKMVLTPRELRQRLQKTDRKWKFSDAEMMTAVGHLENHGYVTRLKTSQGDIRILLSPELLNNLATSFVLEARRNQEGLGSLEEQRLLLGGYKFPELDKLTNAEQDILLDSVAVLFLEHNICFRETNPLNNHAYLVFPELINMKKPLIGDDTPIEDGMAYTVSGAVENVYASLVVLMGYTQNFTRTNQWQNHARYEVGTGHVCGFRLEDERAGELRFCTVFWSEYSRLREDVVSGII